MSIDWRLTLTQSFRRRRRLPAFGQTGNFPDMHALRSDPVQGSRMDRRSRSRPAPQGEDSRSGKFLIPLLATAFLAAPAFAPTAALSDSALAVTNLNTSRSNIARTKTPRAVGGTKARATTVKSSKSNTSDRMGGGGGRSTTRATTVKSSKSNTSDRIGDPGLFGR
jgi:hypothetical protein